MKVTSPGTYERQVYDDLQSSIDQWARVKQRTPLLKRVQDLYRPEGPSVRAVKFEDQIKSIDMMCNPKEQIPSNRPELSGLQTNNTITVLNLADNDLSDRHARLLCNYMKLKSEHRDAELWSMSLRQRLVEKRILEINQRGLTRDEPSNLEKVSRLLNNLDCKETQSKSEMLEN